MSGGVAYVYDESGHFAETLQQGQVDLENIVRRPRRGRQGPDGNAPPAFGVRRPRRRHGRFVALRRERLRILIERHHLLHTGSARARQLLDNWNNAASAFVKMMPKDYRRALWRPNETGQWPRPKLPRISCTARYC
jgi:glutamate synthase (NADPH/NADH) large chain